MAIAHDSTTAYTTNASVTSKTFSHTCSGSERLLLVATSCISSSSITGVTYNGTALSRYNTVTFQSSTFDIWYLVAPSTGANNIVISSSSSTTIGGGAMSFTGVDQTVPMDSTFKDTSQTGSVTSYSISTTTRADNCFLFMNGRANGGLTLTAGTNTTVSQPEVTAFGSFMMRSTAAITPAGSGTLACTSTAQQFFGTIVSIKPSSSTIAYAVFTKDGRNASPAPTTNFGSEAFMYVLPAGGGSNIQRTLIGFTTPNLTGTITNVKLNLYLEVKGSQNASTNYNLHELTRSNWTEAGFTWNTYDGTNNWTTAGGDYSGTVVDAISEPATTGQWYTWEIYGGGADNPVSIAWNTAYNFILKGAAETTSNTDSYRSFTSRSGTNNQPYVEITYTSGATTNSNFFMFM